jgi:hemoglobin-like flavoprotein
MEQQTVKLVQDSWNQVKPMGSAAGTLFYKNLFDADPELRPLFKGNLDEQAAKLIQMINAAVGKLDDESILIPVLQQLGKRHSGYGVLPSHYQTVGAALLKTLEQGLGESFTPATKAAWTSVYGVMAGVMTAEAKN